VIAAISVSGPDKRLSEQQLHELAPKVIEHAALISARLGYRPPKPTKPSTRVGNQNVVSRISG